MQQYISIIKARLEISDTEFQITMDAPPYKYENYKCDYMAPIIRKTLKYISKIQVDGFDAIQIPTRKYGVGKWQSILAN